MDLRRVDLNLLVAFDMLMSERSVTRAAARLHIGQSAMSSTLARLRKLFDDPLLTREGRGLQATPLARSLADPVREVLTDIESVFAKQEIFDPTTDRRSFSIIASDHVAIALLHPLLTRLAVEAPGIRLHLVSTSDDFRDQLMRQEVDLLIMPLEAFEAHPQFQQQMLFRDRYLVAMDKNHPDVGDRITLEQFSSLPYLAASLGNLRSLADLQLDFLGIPRNVETTAGIGVAPFLLTGTRLIALLQERLTTRVAEVAGIKLLEPPFPALQPVTETMIWTRRGGSDPGRRWLRQRLLDLCQEPLAPSAAGS